MTRPRRLSRSQVEFLILIADNSAVGDFYWKPPQRIAFIPSATLGRDIYFSPAHAVLTLQSLARLGLIESYLSGIIPRGDYAPAKRYHVPEDSDVYRYWCWCRVTSTGSDLVDHWRSSDEWPVPFGCLNDQQELNPPA